jgi:amino acid adenylation domain-containing protein
MTPLLQGYLEINASTRPNDIALAMGSEKWSYAALDVFTNQLARSLKRAGCEKGDRVAFILSKAPLAVAAILGILKADCIYVPLDPASPAERVLRIMESSEPRLVLADASNADLTLQIGERMPHSGSRLAWMSDNVTPPDSWNVAFEFADIRKQSSEPHAYRNTGSDGAYILYTSGSTGVPKGVLITHANVMAFVEWGKRYFGIQAGEKISAHTPLHFDLSTFDIFGTLAAGAGLVVVPTELGMSPRQMAQFIRDNELNQWFSVPSVLNYLAKFDAVRQGDFPALQRILWCGEVLPTPILRYWMKRLPHVTFTNLYGPTEATVASSYYTVPRIPDSDTDPIPIGTACEGEDLLVLDADLNPVPQNQPGDLYLRGAGLSPGYWRDPEKTRAAFIESHGRIYKTGDLARIGDDGLIYFLGRADSQIKSRGYRIELGEIESALNTVPMLRESAVVAVSTDAFENTSICCCFAPMPGADITPASVRQKLKEKLPSYMLPTRWMVMDQLPRNANGKIDRRQLKDSFESAGQRVAS